MHLAYMPWWLCNSSSHSFWDTHQELVHMLSGCMQLVNTSSFWRLIIATSHTACAHGLAMCHRSCDCCCVELTMWLWQLSPKTCKCHCHCEAKAPWQCDCHDLAKESDSVSCVCTSPRCVSQKLWLLLLRNRHACAQVEAEEVTVRLVCAGSQYCCWNNDSSLVAVSSDYYRAVMVFDVHKKQQVCLQMLSTMCVNTYRALSNSAFGLLPHACSQNTEFCHLSESVTWWTVAWCYLCLMRSVSTCFVWENELHGHEYCLMQSAQWNGHMLLLPMSICSFHWRRTCCWTVPSCHKEQKDKCVCPSYSRWHTPAWSEWVHQTHPHCSDAVNIVHAHSCQWQPPAFCSLTSRICTVYIPNNIMYIHNKNMYIHNKNMYIHNKNMYIPKNIMYIHIKNMYIHNKNMYIHIKNMYIHNKNMYVPNNIMNMCDSITQMELRLTPTNCNWR